MKTVLVELRDKNALKLLKDLELANIIRLVDDKAGKKETDKKSTGKLRGSMSKKRAQQLMDQLNKMRDEWEKAKNS